MPRHRIIRTAWVVLLLTVASSTFAQDADETLNKPPAEPAETQPLSDADEDLPRQLLGEETLRPRPQGDPLEAAVRGMRDAHGRITQRDTGTGTQDIQEQVIDNLDALINLARQQRQQAQQNPPPQPQQNPDQQQDPQQQQQQEQQQAEQQQDSQPMDPSGDGGEGQAQQSSDTSEQQTRAAEREAELARRRAMVGEVWGHLPPALRERLLNVDSEKYLPKYEDLTRRYFEALADPERRE